MPARRGPCARVLGAVLGTRARWRRPAQRAAAGGRLAGLPRPPRPPCPPYKPPPAHKGPPAAPRAGHCVRLEVIVLRFRAHAPPSAAVARRTSVSVDL